MRSKNNPMSAAFNEPRFGLVTRCAPSMYRLLLWAQDVRVTRGRGADKLLVETKRSCRLCVRAAAWAGGWDPSKRHFVTASSSPLVFFTIETCICCNIYARKRNDDNKNDDDFYIYIYTYIQ